MAGVSTAHWQLLYKQCPIARNPGLPRGPIDYDTKGAMDIFSFNIFHKETFMIVRGAQVLAPRTYTILDRFILYLVKGVL